MKMTGAQAVIECLKREQVQVVFGYPGGAVLTLYDELYKAKFPHILTGHEQGAVHAADGYARATGKPGVCFATSGPGVCNMVTGIATANMDSIPLVVISGQVATPLIGRDSFQEADISGITTPITKHNYLVKNVKELPRVLKEAFYIATTGRPGPVLVDIAKDVFDTPFEFEYPEEVHLRGYQGHHVGNEADVDRAVEAIEKAKRPVILTGGGVVLSNMSDRLKHIVQQMHVPVVTTLMGKGCVPDTYDAHLGMVGMHGSYAANMAVTKCDLLVAIGARFDDRVTGDVENFAPNAQIVHFDIDKVEINKIVHADISVNGDLRWSLPLLDEKLAAHKTHLADRYSEWRTFVLDMKAAHPFATRDLPDAVSPQQLFEEVQKWTDDDTIVVTDVGQHQMWAAQFFNLNKPRRFVTSGGLGTMGYGLPAALGAKMARPEAQVVQICGDGGFKMTGMELYTAMRESAPFITVVINNSCLGMVRQWQQVFYDQRYSSTILTPFDFVGFARYCGADGATVTTCKEFAAALAKARKQGGNFLIEAVVKQSDLVEPMVAPGAVLDDFVKTDA